MLPIQISPNLILSRRAIAILSALANERPHGEAGEMVIVVIDDRNALLDCGSLEACGDVFLEKALEIREKSRARFEPAPPKECPELRIFQCPDCGSNVDRKGKICAPCCRRRVQRHGLHKGRDRK